MRLLTRSDFDGLVCATILEELGIVDEVVYVHPKDLQDNKISVTENDVLANVPFVPGCGLWFDHHSSEEERLQLEGKYKGSCKESPSTARVIVDYYKDNAENAGKLSQFGELLSAVDKADAGLYTKEDIENPQGWMMLAFIADPRTGLGYHHHFRISNFELMKSLPGLLRTKTIDEILGMPDFQERVELYHKEAEKYKQFILDHTKAEKNAIIIDLRGVSDIPSGNRFLEYVLFPDQNISIRLVDGKNKEFVMVSVGTQHYQQNF